MPARNTPAWLMVEKASSRLMCRSRKQNSAPTTAVSTPSANRSKMSPVRQKPVMPARKVSMSVW